MGLARVGSARTKVAGDAKDGPARTSEMRFRRLCLKNWKNFREVDIAVHDRMFLVGANGSGKSNLLDAFRFLRDLALPGGLNAAVARRKGVDAIRCLAAPKDADVGIEVEVEAEDGGSRWRYALSFGQDAQSRPCVRAEHVSRDGRAVLDRPDSDDRSNPVFTQQTHLEQVSRSVAFHCLQELFASIRHADLVPQVVREPDGTVGSFHHRYGGRFVQDIARTPADERDFILNRIEKALRIAIPYFESLGLVNDSTRVPHLVARSVHWRETDALQAEDQLSDGTLRLIGLFWAAMKSAGPLLVEEPELFLHPDVVRMLAQAMDSAQRGSRRQLFMSTHSPNLMWDEEISLEETLLLLTDGKAAHAVAADSVEQVRLLVEGGSSIAEAVIPCTQPRGTWRLALFADGD